MSRGHKRLIVAGVLLFALYIVLDGPLTRLFRGNGRPQFSSAPCLRIVTYSTMASSFGAGTALVNAFARQYGCQPELIAGDSHFTLLNFLTLVEKDKPVDIVLGLDQIEFVEGSAKKLFRQLRQADWPKGLKVLPLPATQEAVIFDWAPLTFIYREREVAPPLEAKDMIEERYQNQLSLADPELSPTGWAYLWWLTSGLPSEELAERIALSKAALHSVSPGWSTAYGLFQKKIAKLVFSYATSAVYHWVEEKNKRYQVAVFSDGHPFQAEYAAIRSTCDRCDIAENFLRFLLQREAQRLLMEKNYMLPVLEEVIKGTPFADLPEMNLLPPESWTEFAQKRSELLQVFKQTGRP